MRLPKDNDLVTVRINTDFVSEGDNQWFQPYQIDEQFIERLTQYPKMAYRVYNTEETYITIEFPMLRQGLCGTEREVVLIDVSLVDINSVNGVRTDYLQLPPNYDEALSDSFPPICAN